MIEEEERAPLPLYPQSRLSKEEKRTRIRLSLSVCVCVSKRQMAIKKYKKKGRQTLPMTSLSLLLVLSFSFSFSLVTFNTFPSRSRVNHSFNLCILSQREVRGGERRLHCMHTYQGVLFFFLLLPRSFKTARVTPCCLT